MITVLKNLCSSLRELCLICKNITYRTSGANWNYAQVITSPPLSIEDDTHSEHPETQSDSPWQIEMLLAPSGLANPFWITMEIIIERYDFAVETVKSFHNDIYWTDRSSVDK